MRVKSIMIDEPLPYNFKDLYESTGQCDEHLDEGDLIIFRLMGVKFKYSNVEFEDNINHCDELVESDVS